MSHCPETPRKFIIVSYLIKRGKQERGNFVQPNKHKQCLILMQKDIPNITSIVHKSPTKQLDKQLEKDRQTLKDTTFIPANSSERIEIFHFQNTHCLCYTSPNVIQKASIPRTKISIRVISLHLPLLLKVQIHMVSVTAYP